MTDHIAVAAEKILRFAGEVTDYWTARVLIQEAVNAELAPAQAKITDLRGVIEGLEGHTKDLERCLMQELRWARGEGL